MLPVPRFFHSFVGFHVIIFLTHSNTKNRSAFDIRPHEWRTKSHLRNNLRFRGAVEKGSIAMNAGRTDGRAAVPKGNEK